mgnify:FL=1
MDNEQLANQLMESFLNIKSKYLHNIIKIDGYPKNEKIILFLLYDFKEKTGEDKILLSKLRERINLAPSTVTPIITSLEKKGLINRIIDKNDRRNIFIGLSKKALKEASFAKQELKNNIYGYIEYMGKEDTQEFIRLIEKTNNYFKKERKVKK